VIALVADRYLTYFIFDDLDHFLPVHIAMCSIGVVSSAVISVLYITDLDDECHIASMVEGIQLLTPLLDENEKKEFDGNYVESY
jgi:hypothetical protein